MLGRFEMFHVSADFSNNGNGGSGADAGNGYETFSLNRFLRGFIEHGSFHFCQMKAEGIIVFHQKAEKIHTVFGKRTDDV